VLNFEVSEFSSFRDIPKKLFRGNFTINKFGLGVPWRANKQAYITTRTAV
jgi:hypothetical protein